MAGNLLEVRNLKKYYSVKSGFLNKDCRSVKAVDGINLSVKQGEILGIVGESGCGKSTLGRSILRLIEPTSGEVIFEGTNICGLKKEEMRLKRREMQIVFQDPYSSLPPRPGLKMIRFCCCAGSTVSGQRKMPLPRMTRNKS